MVPVVVVGATYLVGEAGCAVVVDGAALFLQVEVFGCDVFNPFEGAQLQFKAYKLLGPQAIFPEHLGVVLEDVVIV